MGAWSPALQSIMQIFNTEGPTELPCPVQHVLVSHQLTTRQQLHLEHAMGHTGDILRLFVPLQIWPLTKFNSCKTSQKLIFYHQKQRLNYHQPLLGDDCFPTPSLVNTWKHLYEKKKISKLPSSHTITISISTFCTFFSFHSFQFPEYQQKRYQEGRILNVSGGSRNSKLIRDKYSTNNKPVSKPLCIYNHVLHQGLQLFWFENSFILFYKPLKPLKPRLNTMKYLKYVE